MAVRPEAIERAGELLRKLVGDGERVGLALTAVDGAVAWFYDGETVGFELVEAPDQMPHTPTEKELAKESGFPEKRVRELLDLVEDPVSLETPVGDGESMYADLIEDVHSERPDESTSKKLRQSELADALLLLNPRMRRVLSLRFGLNGEVPQTLEEVGAGLGITRERVRQLESRALRELRAVAPDLELYLRT